jgi:hypothetical protein
MLSFTNPYEAYKEAHAIAVLGMGWVRRYDWQHLYDAMQKPALFLMEEIDWSSGKIGLCIKV